MYAVQCSQKNLDSNCLVTNCKDHSAAELYRLPLGFVGSFSASVLVVLHICAQKETVSFNVSLLVAVLKLQGFNG